MQNNGKVIPVKIHRTAKDDIRDIAQPHTVPTDLADANTLTPHALPMQELVDRSGRLTIHHQLAVGMQPELFIEWRADPVLLCRGYRVLIFRNQNGFASTTGDTPVDQPSHGEQIVHATEDDRLLLPVTEGDHFFTAMLVSPIPMTFVARKIATYRSRYMGSTTRVMGFLQFHVHVPSIATATERIVRESEHYEARDRYVRSRERLDQRLGRTDADFVIRRHRLQADVETSKRIAEFEQIKQSFQRKAQQVRTDPNKSADQRDAELAELQALLRAHLAAANFPAIDLRD